MSLVERFYSTVVAIMHVQTKSVGHSDLICFMQALYKPIYALGIQPVSCRIT